MAKQSSIDRSRWKILEPLLDEALELTPEEREPWLRALRESTPDVAADLGALLSEDASIEREGFLAEPLRLTLEGLDIGAYTLERPLGHGGMGSVWLARRTDGRFEGYAAVKLLNLSLLSAAGQERFRREGSMLARLTHPGIARLLDAGVSRSGQPYLVLEYVDGERLDAYATSHALTRDERIRLFLQVLDAVGHAHANLIVHRDLKPSNILVTKDGAVKLLDFGIATLTHAEGAGDEGAGDESTVVTIDGGHAFTPQFAAPEQVRGEPVTTATDVYSLGVILYQLLAGRHPTSQDSKSPADSVRSILDVQPLPITPRDLNAVVGKALRKEAAQRYQNVETFADDLRRFLRHEPVSASRDAVLYRARKFARRHRAGVAIGAVVAGILIAATAFSEREMREAKRQRDAAVLARRRADAQADFATMLMSQLGDKPMTVKEILDRARDGMEHQFVGDSGFVLSALLQLGAQYDELGDSKARRALIMRADSIAAAMRDPVSVIDVRCNLADELRTEGKYADAERVLQQADSMLRRSPDPNVEAECQLSRAALENETGHVEKSAPAIHRAIAIRDSLGETHDMFYVALLVDLGHTLDEQNRSREAMAVQKRLLALLDTTGRGRTTTSAIVRHNLAMIYLRVGETATADSILYDGMMQMVHSDPTGRIPQQFLIHYAHTVLYQGDADSASKYFEILANEGVADHNDYWRGRALFGLAQAQLARGDITAARNTIEQFRAISKNPDLRHSDDQVVNVNTLDALVALAGGDTAKGNALVQQTLHAYGYFTGKRSNILHSTLMLAAQTALALHHPDSALAYARDARVSATKDSLSRTRSARVGDTWLIEARADLQRGDGSGARAAATRAVQALSAGAGHHAPRTREAQAFLDKLR